MPRSLRSAALPLVVALVALAGLAPPAWAHVEIDPVEAEAGSTITLSLRFHHGLEEAATTGLEVQLPEGAVLVAIPPKDGWSATERTEAGRTVVSWAGGRVPDGEEAAFPLEVTLPATAGEVLFATIQITEAGELAWIEAEASDSEDAKPAPRLTLVGDPSATTTTSAAPTSTTPVAPSTTLDLPGTTNQAEQRDDGDESPAPWLIGGGIAAAAMVGAGGWWLSRRG